MRKISQQIENRLVTIEGAQAEDAARAVAMADVRMKERCKSKK